MSHSYVYFHTMDYPFSFLRSGDYLVSEILRPIPIEQEQADPGDFPNNIVEYLWVREGENDEEEWKAYGVLSNGNYFFYKASCDYTGFDCQGWMHLWVSSSTNHILDYAMTPDDRKEMYSA